VKKYEAAWVPPEWLPGCKWIAPKSVLRQLSQLQLQLQLQLWLTDELGSLHLSEQSVLVSANGQASSPSRQPHEKPM